MLQAIGVGPEAKNNIWWGPYSVDVNYSELKKFKGLMSNC